MAAEIHDVPCGVRFGASCNSLTRFEGDDHYGMLCCAVALCADVKIRLTQYALWSNMFVEHDGSYLTLCIDEVGECRSQAASALRSIAQLSQA